MAQTTWTTEQGESLKPRSNRMQYVVGGVLILAALAFLIANAMSGNTQLYKTVDEFYAEQSRLVGRDLRVSGYVLGDSIQFVQIDATTSRLEFDIVDNINNPVGGCTSSPKMSRCRSAAARSAGARRRFRRCQWRLPRQCRRPLPEVPDPLRGSRTHGLEGNPSSLTE